MNPYNGFTGDQRNRAQRWLNSQWAAGHFPRPAQCCACGQADGIIDAHAEDYSEPFRHGKTDQYPLCFVCHMMVHCRFKNPAAWDRYRELIGRGCRPMAFATRNFPRFASMYLGATMLPEHWTKHAAPIRRYLDGINGRSGTPPAPAKPHSHIAG